jgi:hypothetical protein
MAIGIIFRFPPTATDASKTYDAIVDEMGVRNNPAQGAIYHWAAPAHGGLVIVDLWETQKDFDHFAQEKIYPLTQKHGLPKPNVEHFEVHNIIDARDRAASPGIGLILSFKTGADGLALYDKANAMMDAVKNPPEGLVIHWAAKSPDGLAVSDVWESQAHLDRFMREKLGPTSGTLELSKPTVETYNIHNVLSGHARVKL